MRRAGPEQVAVEVALHDSARDFETLVADCSVVPWRVAETLLSDVVDLFAPHCCRRI